MTKKTKWDKTELSKEFKMIKEEIINMKNKKDLTVA